MARRRPGPRAGRLSAADLSFDEGYNRDRPQPTPLFPDYLPLKPRAATDLEKRQVFYLHQIQDAIHNGPLYAHLDTDTADSTTTGSHGAASAAINTRDSFRAMPRYSQRYAQGKRTLPSFEPGKFVLNFFPKELWSTLDPRYRVSRQVRTKKGKEKAKSSAQPSRDIRLEAGADDGGDADEDGLGKAVDAQGHVIAGTGEEGAGEQAAEDEEDLDDEFDDEEEAGDYNAEQYFDDGEEDRNEDFEGGEEASGYFD